MKNIMLIAVLLISAGTFAQQGNRKPLSIEEKLSNVITKIENKIELTDSQKEVIEKSFTDFFTKADKEMKLDKRPEKVVMEAFEKERDQKIKAVFSNTQYEEYLKISCQLKPQPQTQGQRPPRQN